MPVFKNLNNLSSYENQYANLSKIIMTSGTEELNERTKLKTKRIPMQQFSVVNTPILLGKTVYWKSAIEEILWIMQKGSNNIHDLRPHIWDEWADEDGSIGKAYGYQISTYKQVEKLLDDLSKNPSSRRGVLNLWNVADLDEMNLVPCCYSSVWNITDGRLNCMLTQRSGDIGLGVPFNTLQYYALLKMFAAHLHVNTGILMHCIADAHIYENQYEGMNRYINNAIILNELIDDPNNIPKFDEEKFVDRSLNDLHLKISSEEEYNSIIDEATKISGNYDQDDIIYPELILNTEKDNFWDFTIDDFSMLNYHPMNPIKFDVAI